MRLLSLLTLQSLSAFYVPDDKTYGISVGDNEKFEDEVFFKQVMEENTGKERQKNVTTRTLFQTLPFQTWQLMR